MIWTARIEGMPMTVRLGRDDEGRPVDIHASFGPPGNPLSLACEAVCRAASVNLRAGVPLSAVLAKWRGQRFEPAGRTHDPLAPECTSIVDYLAASVAARAG